jgi:calcium-dependent protein kinase
MKDTINVRRMQFFFDHISPLFPTPSRQMVHLKNEVKIMKELNHPNIVRLYECYWSEKELYLVMEYCKGGELTEWVTAKTPHTEDQIAQVMNSMLSAMAYMHKQGITHRDIKPENVMFELRSDGVPEIKLADFGCGKISKGNIHGTDIAGTLPYMAPEVLNQKIKYDAGCDVWSLGIVCYELCSGRRPFDWHKGCKDCFGFQRAIKDKTDGATGKLRESMWMNGRWPWHRLTTKCRDFVQLCMAVEPSGRPSCEKLLTHPWLKETKRRLSVVAMPPTMTSLSSRILEFSHFDELKQTALLACAFRGLTVQQESLLRKAFRKYDGAGNGYITLDEIKAMMETEGIVMGEHDAIKSVFKGTSRGGSFPFSFSPIILCWSHFKSSTLFHYFLPFFLSLYQHQPACSIA